MALEEDLQRLLSSENTLDAGELVRLLEFARTAGRNPDRLEALLIYIGGHLASTKTPERALFLRGAALEIKGETLSAQQAWLLCCERLLHIKSHDSLRDVARRCLALGDSPAAARYALRASETLFGKGKDVADLRLALQDAHRLIPDDPDITIRLAKLVEEREGLENAIPLYADAMEGFVRKKRFEEAEESFLRVLEGRDRSCADRALQAAASVARSGDPGRAATLLDLALPRVKEAGLGQELLDAIRSLAAGKGDLSALRPVVLSTLGILHGGKPHHDPLVRGADFDNPAVPLGESFRRMDAILAFPPGRYVVHATSGIGLIRSNDGESVITDFPGKTGHRMALDMARRSLTLLREEDLRAVRAADPGLLSRLAREDPAAVLLAALKHLGGEGDQRKLKKLLVDQGAVELGSWPSWWKKAKDAARRDPRLDGRDAYRDIVRLLAPGGLPSVPATAPHGDGEKKPAHKAAPSGEFRLPELKRTQKISTGIALVRRLLREHPEAEDAAKERFSGLLEEWLGRKARPPEERAAVLPFLLRWVPERRPEWAARLAGALEEGLELNEFPAREEQEALLDVALESPAWEKALLGTLNSRYPALRDRALGLLVERSGGGEAATQALGKAMHAETSRSLLHIAAWHEREGGQGLAALVHPWRLAVGLASLLATRPSTRASQDILQILRTDGILARRAAEVPCPIPLVSALLLAGRKMRFEVETFPKLIEFLKAAGLRAAETLEAEAFPLTGKRKVEEPVEIEEEGGPVGGAPVRIGIFGGGASTLPPGTAVMTRPTFVRLKGELRKLAEDLRTTIPEAIRRAREHGDLSENFEYKSAKERQAYTDARASQLREMLSHVRFVEDLPHEEGLVGPGMEVQLKTRETGEERWIWILGDGDDSLAENVISLRSPMAQTLVGKKPGDEVALLRAGETIHYLVEEVRRRLPEPPSQAVREEEPLPEIVHGEEE